MEESIELVESMREEHCPNSLEAKAWFLKHTRQLVVLPNSVSSAIGFAQTIGIVLIMILAASSMGGEYGLGHFAGGTDQGYQTVAVAGNKSIICPAV